MMSKTHISIYPLTVLCLLFAFGCSLFFNGLSSPLFAPAFAGIVTIAGITAWRAKYWPYSTTSIWLLAWWGYLALTCVFSAIIFNSLLFLGIFSFLPLLFFTALMDTDPDKWLKAHWAALLLSIAVLAGWALIQFFVWQEEYGPRIHHPLSNPNTLAGLFMMVLLPVLGQYLTAKNKVKTQICLLFATLLFTAILTTNSRGAMLSGTISFIVLAAFLPHTKIVTRRLATYAVLCIGAYILVHTNAQTGEGFAEFNKTGSIGARLTIWESAWDMIKQRPFAGTGLGTFYAFYPPFRSITDISGGLWAHSDPLQFWVELGIGGIVLFYSLLIAVLLRTVTALRARAGKSNLEIMLPLSGLIALILHTHITFHLYQAAVLIPLSILLAMWYRATAIALAEKTLPIKRTSQSIFRVVVCVIAFTALIWVGKAGIGVYLVNEARNKLLVGDIQNFADKINKAYDISPQSYALPPLYIAEFNSVMLQQKTISLSKKDYRNYVSIAERMLKEAELSNPKEPVIQHAKAVFYTVTDRKSKARSIWKKNLHDNPQHFQTRMALADILLKNGEQKKALKILKDGLYWPYKQNPMEYYKKTVYVSKLSGNTATYQLLSQKLQEFTSFRKTYPRASIKPLLFANDKTIITH